MKEAKTEPGAGGLCPALLEALWAFEEAQRRYYPGIAPLLAERFAPLRENLERETKTLASPGYQHFLPASHQPAGDWLKDTSATLPNIRYDLMFKQFGIHTELVERDGEMKPALKRAFDYVRKANKPAFVEVFIDPDPLQEIWVQGLTVMMVGNIPWDDLTEKTKEILDLTWERIGPGYMAMAHPSWAENIFEYREKKGK